MSKVTEKLEKKFAGIFPAEEIRDLVAQYEIEVRRKCDLFMETIKFNSGDGLTALEMKEACQWVDAAQATLCTLFQALMALEMDPLKPMTKDFIRKVRANLETIANEGK